MYHSPVEARVFPSGRDAPPPEEEEDVEGTAAEDMVVDKSCKTLGKTVEANHGESSVWCVRNRVQTLYQPVRLRLYYQHFHSLRQHVCDRTIRLQSNQNFRCPICV